MQFFFGQYHVRTRQILPTQMQNIYIYIHTHIHIHILYPTPLPRAHCQNKKDRFYKYVAYSSTYNQKDATLYNILYCCQCSTCFGRFLRPSSGAQNSELYTQHLVCVVLNFELLMMGGETARNMQSTDSNKEYYITLHLVGYTWKNTLTMHGPMNVRSTLLLI
jgi:hypothetical protein